MDEVYGVYVRTDDAGRVAAVNSDAFLPDTTGLVRIDEGSGTRYMHAQGNYLPDTIVDERGVYRYKVADGALVERSAEEMEADFAARPAPEPTAEELLIEMAGDHEYRLCLMELGVSDSDL